MEIWQYDEMFIVDKYSPLHKINGLLCNRIEISSLLNIFLSLHNTFQFLNAFHSKQAVKRLSKILDFTSFHTSATAIKTPFVIEIDFISVSNCMYNSALFMSV